MSTSSDPLSLLHHKQLLSLHHNLPLLHPTYTPPRWFGVQRHHSVHRGPLQSPGVWSKRLPAHIWYSTLRHSESLTHRGISSFSSSLQAAGNAYVKSVAIIRPLLAVGCPQGSPTNGSHYTTGPSGELLSSSGGCQCCRTPDAASTPAGRCKLRNTPDAPPCARCASTWRDSRGACGAAAPCGFVRRRSA